MVIMVFRSYDLRRCFFLRQGGVPVAKMRDLRCFLAGWLVLRQELFFPETGPVPSAP